MKEIEVDQKENRKGNWICYATVDGYDHSYEAVRIEDAQLLMSRALHKKGYTALFTKPEKYIHEPIIEMPKIGYQRVRLDYL